MFLIASGVLPWRVGNLLERENKVFAFGVQIFSTIFTFIESAGLKLRTKNQNVSGIN